MFNLNQWTLTLCAILLALVLDSLFGEARRFHPLVGFGWLAGKLERHFNREGAGKAYGLLATGLAILPFALLAYLLDALTNGLIHLLISAFVLYLAIGWRSLLEHAAAVKKPLSTGKLEAARDAVGRIVSRDCQQLNETEVAKAATESVLENGADALFAALFWFALAGLPGVVIYRLANTLDAMWGYKNTRFIAFGWAAARFDDLLNFLPARLTALSYALVGNTNSALQCWLTQAKRWKSPNAGPVMAAGAGAIQVSLGGPAVYHGRSQERPLLGLAPSKAHEASAQSIKAACHLVNKSLVLWLGLLLSATLLAELLQRFTS